MTFDKVLVPLDGSRLAEAALPKAVEVAEAVLRQAEMPVLMMRHTEGPVTAGGTA
jgi:nucleotide-binding universal stress UspA family protein